MNSDTLRREIGDFLNFHPSETLVPFAIQAVVEHQTYIRSLIAYRGREGDSIPAYLLLPKGSGPFPAVLVNHQHNGERHLGKSEVCGLVGDPLQAFGPALAQRGIAVLAPDSICFEDRRRNQTGIEPDEDADADWLQHYNEMSYRLVLGDTLMRKVLDDAALGISLLQAHPAINKEVVGVLGHSYGGNTVLFHAGLDTRLRFACASGAACTYQNKMRHETGIEMAQVIPGFAQRFDIPDLVRCVAPRRLLIVSATEDKFARDAEAIVASAQEFFAHLGAEHHLEHKRYDGGHALTQERFEAIVAWIEGCCFTK
jgi:dienelactone hydrolase